MVKDVFINPRKQKDVVRHFSKLGKGYFYLMQETSGLWIMEVAADKPLIQARRYMLDGYELG